MGLHRYRYVYRHSSSLPPTHGYSATGAIFYISLRPETSLSVRSSPSHSNFVIIALVSGWSLLALEPGRLYRVKQYSSVGGWLEPETSLVREWEIPLRFSSFNVMWCFTHNATPTLNCRWWRRQRHRRHLENVGRTMYIHCVVRAMPACCVMGLCVIVGSAGYTQ